MQGLAGRAARRGSGAAEAAVATPAQRLQHRPPPVLRRPRLLTRADAAATPPPPQQQQQRQQQRQQRLPEVRICTGKVCKKQGSEQIARFGNDLGLRDLVVVAGGCLGNCGNGPNAVVLPQGLMLRHISTPAALVQALRAFCNANVSDEVLRATELRLAGNALATGGDLEGAVAKYTEALEACPSSGSAYMVYSNLSATQLQLGNKEAALEAARAAVAGAPRGFHKAHVRLIDALYACGRFGEAEAALDAAVAADPGFKALPEHRLIVQALMAAKSKSHA